MEDLIKDYFRRGFNYNSILGLLNTEHGISISLKTLKRRLKSLELYRRKNYTDLEIVIRHLKNDILGYGQLHGYRMQHQRSLQANLVVTQDTIRHALKVIDPVGVDHRLRKRLKRRVYSNPGPNYLWHLDAYDKLKPFGLYISGCIDGYSRFITWLEVGTTNSDPGVIGGYFLSSIIQQRGIPLSIRADCGTENGTVDRLQNELRNIYSNSRMRPFLYGTSQHNQRIESWWSQLRKHQSQFWLNLFNKLKNDGYFDGSDADKGLIQFCFTGIIKEELREVVFTWNNHLIQKSRNAIAPTGRPFILYHNSGTQNYLVPVDKEDLITICRPQCHFESLVCSEDVYNECTRLMEELNLTFPNDAFEAASLYVSLRNRMQS